MYEDNSFYFVLFLSSFVMSLFFLSTYVICWRFQFSCFSGIILRPYATSMPLAQEQVQILMVIFPSKFISAVQGGGGEETPAISSQVGWNCGRNRNLGTKTVQPHNSVSSRSSNNIVCTGSGNAKNKGGGEERADLTKDPVLQIRACASRCKRWSDTAIIDGSIQQQFADKNNRNFKVYFTW